MGAVKSYERMETRIIVIPIPIHFIPMESHGQIEEKGSIVRRFPISYHFRSNKTRSSGRPPIIECCAKLFVAAILFNSDALFDGMQFHVPQSLV